MVTISLGYPAYNEEKNMSNLLEHLLDQQVPRGIVIKEIIIVASGCTDKTTDIVRKYQKESPTIKLIEEKERRGHASAVNEIIKNAIGDILIIGCADTQPNKNLVSLLVEPLVRDSDIGAVTGRAVPLNNPNTLWGYIANKSFYWNYLPEFLMIDFEGHTAMRRELLAEMPQDSIYTERLADAMIREKGLLIVHNPDALTYIKEPDNFNDFINQKRRNIYMHLKQKKQNIPAPHIDIKKIIPTVFRSLEPNPRKMFWLATMLGMWGYAFILGWFDVIMGRSQKQWRMVISSKYLGGT